MARNILFFLPSPFWQSHFISMIEMIIDHKQQNDNIFLMQCKGEYNFACLYCKNFSCQKSIDCAKCKYFIKKTLELINLKDYLFLPIINDGCKFTKVPKFHSINEIKAFTVDNFDIGLAILSNLYFKTKKTCFTASQLKKYLPYLNKLINLSYQIYKTTYEYLEKYKIDEIYIFNGRFDILRASLRAAQKYKKSKIKVLEAAGVMDKFTISENTYPHDFEYQKKILNELWSKEKSYIKKETLARKWFLDRLNAKDQGNISYIKKQIKNKLPSNFSNKKRNISIFISSEHEISTIPEYKNPLFKNQLETIKFILKYFKKKYEYNFYIRMHPNLKDVNDCYILELKKINRIFNNAFIIEPDSPIDSYALLKKSEKIISFGSTIGIEAVLYKIPSILIGKAIFEDSISLYIPKTKKEIIFLIEKKLKPLNNIMAIKYGYYQMKRGRKYKYYKPEHPYYGKFLGRNIFEL
ncbi:hypothetical protein [Hippea maritima]|uniref:Capsule polysaccharide biosynthesis protein n=1 Tax=Hippea maritima (strain ATCC 700847 / DSM 10411 / MH2) TaxID=760142 RepID=F2LUL3_HIPMA|nr:hypothetical protein [Hippea maritima]AEA34603.1 hypothetical protein Hipma_1653 [Hippea maritima DSM 10411]